MFCDTCGADNKETAAFCRTCGAEIADAETRVARRQAPSADEVRSVPIFSESYPLANVDSKSESADDADERVIFKISPTLMFVKMGYVAAGLVAIGLVALVASLTAVSPIFAVLIGMLLLLIPAFYHIKQRLISYTLTESQLEIDAGLISRTTRSVPIRRIQDVTVTTTIMQRLFGFGDLMVDNASDEGGKVVLSDIDSPKKYGDILLRQMRRLEK